MTANFKQNGFKHILLRQKIHELQIFPGSADKADLYLYKMTMVIKAIPQVACSSLFMTI